jgi:YggT family protein
MTATVPPPPPAGASMRAILDVVLIVLNLYTWVVIAAAVFSWLYAFNVVNPRNNIVATIGNVLYRLTEPVVRPIRRFMPDLGGIDLSPVVLLLLIFLIQNIIVRYIYPNVF